MKKILFFLALLGISATGFATGHTVSVTGTNVTCNGGFDGTATATVSGGVGPFGFSWPPASLLTTPTIAGLPAGTFTVMVIDSSDMSFVYGTITITEPPLLSASISGGGVTICSGACTPLTVIASGGTPAYTYTWTPSGSMLPTYSACPITGSSYTVVVTDMNGCTATSVTSIGATVVPVTVNSPTICAGDTANLIGTGATTYAWSGGMYAVTGGGMADAWPTATTTYTVSGTSAGCTGTAISIVTVNPMDDASFYYSSSYFCQTASNPTPTVTGLTPGAFSSTAGLIFISTTTGEVALAASSPGAHTIYYTTGGTCPNIGMVSFTIDTVVAISLPPSYNVCSGSAVMIGFSPTPFYTYSWTLGSTLSSSTISNPIAAPTFTSTYTLTVTNGICYGTATTTIFVDGPITSNITSTNATDCISNDGTASVSPTGGTGPYLYDWNFATTPVGEATATISLRPPGVNYVQIMDASGCQITDSTTVFAANDLIANFTMVPDSTDPYNFFAFNTSTGGGLSYSWEWGDGTPDPGTANPSHLYTVPGVYNVCLIASNFLCGADTLCQAVTVTGVSTPCNALFNIADDTINPDPNAHYVYNLSYGATLTYLWDFGDGTTSTSATPSHVYAGTGPYLLCLSIDNGAGCTDMFCDSLISADSINRSSGIMQLVVYDVPTFYSTSTGIANAMEACAVTIAPNPFNETTIFTVNSNEVYSFELTDVLGKKVKAKNGISEKQFEISRDGLENGIYFYKIFTSESLVGIGKVIIK